MTSHEVPGRFGIYGGKYVPETLVSALEELERVYLSQRDDPSFQEELRHYLATYGGRPSPLYCARSLSEALGCGKIYLKREDLVHTGSHKLNNTLGQILLARRMSKKRVIAETGAGQHGVATATVAALFGMECDVYMGEEDIARQELNVYRMELLGARVIPVTSGTKTLKDALNEAIRDWVTTVESTHYIIGSVAGPHPYPMMVRDFQRVIGRETRLQLQQAEGKVPDYLIACVGGGSNAIGLFYDFLKEEGVRMIGVEAGGLGIPTGQHAARFAAGKRGVLHGAYTYILQTEEGQIKGTHSVAAGLDYPGVGPEHSYLREIGRVEYVHVDDNEAVDAFMLLSETEGILPALESSHAIAYMKKLTSKLENDALVVINLSGRGDKDVNVIRDALKNRP